MVVGHCRFAVGDVGGTKCNCSGFKLGHFCLKTHNSGEEVANSATACQKIITAFKNIQLLRSLKELLQKLQIVESLMQNSIINGLFVVVAWHYEKNK